jgi:hypothetical protein
MRKMAVTALSLFALVGVVSCGTSPQSAFQQHRQTELKAFKPITYVRNIGSDEPEERITVAADGSVLRKRAFGPSGGRLSEFQIMQLVRVFENWERLHASYAAAEDSTGAPVTTIIYGEKKVTVSDAAKEIPDDFTLARQRIELLVRDLTPAR